MIAYRHSLQPEPNRNPESGMSPGWVPSLDAKKNGSQIGLDLAQILKHAVDFPDADRREFPGLNGQRLRWIRCGRLDHH